MTEAGGAAVRRARAGDMEAVAGIEAGAFANPWSAEVFPRLLARRDVEFVVATEQEAVVGYAVAVVAGAEAELANVAVKGERRGSGVGEALVTRLIRTLADQGVRTLCLAVRASNAPAIRFYRRMEFLEIGADPGHYSNPSDDALVFVREL